MSCFDEIVLAKEFLQSYWVRLENEEDANDRRLSSEKIVSGHFKDSDIAIPNSSKVYNTLFACRTTRPQLKGSWKDGRGIMKQGCRNHKNPKNPISHEKTQFHLQSHQKRA